MTRVRPDRPSGDGYILVAVLGVMVVLTGFMAAGSLLVRSALDTARVDDAEVPLRGLAIGGLELTAYQLFVTKAPPAAIDGLRIRFGGGSIAPRIRDEAAKADLNGSDPKLLAAIFQSAGLDSRTAGDLLSYVIEMRGPGRAPPAAAAPPVNVPAPNPDAASIEIPPGAKPTPGAKTMLRGFLSVDQLKDFRDLTRADWRALRPLLTVFNPDGKINILSASSSVLKAVPGLSSADTAVILTRRDHPAKKEIDALLSTLGDAKTYVKATFGPAFTIRVDAISETGHKKAINAVVAASKSPNDPYYVLDWWE